LADLACHVCVIDDGGYAYCRPVLVVHHSNELAKPRCVTRHVPSRRRRGRNIRSGAAPAARRGCSARPFWTAPTNWAAGGFESGYVVGLAADGRLEHDGHHVCIGLGDWSSGSQYLKPASRSAVVMSEWKRLWTQWRSPRRLSRPHRPETGPS